MLMFAMSGFELLDIKTLAELVLFTVIVLVWPTVNTTPVWLKEIALEFENPFTAGQSAGEDSGPLNPFSVT